MSDFFKRLFGKLPSTQVTISEPFIPPFPEDYAWEAKKIIQALKEFKKNEDEQTIDLVYDFYLHTISWIDAGEPVDCRS